MIIDKEVDKYYKENYKNEKRGTSLNINKQLWIDVQKTCLELSRKSKNKITGSFVVRKFMVEFVMENKKKD